MPKCASPRESSGLTTCVWRVSLPVLLSVVLVACGSDSPLPSDVFAMRSISIDSRTLSLIPGDQQRVLVKVAAHGPQIELSAEDVPAGLSVSFEPRVLAPGLTSSVMTIIAGPPVEATIRIRAASSDGMTTTTQGTAAVTVSVRCPGYAVPTMCPPFPTGGDLSVTGIVRERTMDGLRPVEGVKVWAWVQRQTNGYSAGGVISGAGGAYTFGILPVSFVVFQAWGSEWDQPCGAGVQLTGNGQTVDIEVVSISRPIYDPTPAAPGITGLVYEQTAAGRLPVAGARVWLEAPVEVYTATTTTDTEGRYSFCRVPPITTYASVWKDGYAPLWKPVSPSGVSVTDFEITRK